MKPNEDKKQHRLVGEIALGVLVTTFGVLNVFGVIHFTAFGDSALGETLTSLAALGAGLAMIVHPIVVHRRKSAEVTQGAATGKKSSPKKKKTPEPEETAWERFKANVRMVGGAVLLAVFIRVVLFEAFEIDGPSMEPTLQNGDRVVVAKMLYGLFLPWTNEAALSWGEPNVGDVVIVHSPLDGVDIVKRVIGVAGDTIEVRGREIIRNGEALPIEDLGPCHEDEQLDIDSTDSCHVFEETLPDGHGGELTYRVSDSDNYVRSTQPVTVPEGHVFVRGDHRDRSNDSTNPRIGPVPINRIKGRALSIYLSCYDDLEAEGKFGFGRFRLECDEARWDRFFTMVR